MKGLSALPLRFLVACFSAAFLVALSAYYADIIQRVLSAFGPFDDVVCFCTVGLLAFAVIEYDITKRTCVLCLCLCSAFGLCCDVLPLRGSCAARGHGVLVVVCSACGVQCMLHCVYCAVCTAHAVRAVLWCSRTVVLY